MATMLSSDPATLEVTYEDHALSWPIVVASLAAILFALWLVWRRNPPVAKTIAITLAALFIASTLLGLALDHYASEAE